jgi:fused signal recognition particle receptor
MRRWFRRKKEKEEESLTESGSPAPAEAEAGPEGEAQVPGPEEAAPLPEAPEPPPAEAAPEQPSVPREEEAVAPEKEVTEERRPGFFRRLFRGEEEAPPPPPEPGEPQAQAEAAPEPGLTPTHEAEALPETGESVETELPSAHEEPPTEAVPPEEEALEAEEPEALEEVPVARRGLFKRFRDRLRRSREALAGGLDRLFLGRKEVDAELLEELEELLITADLGVDTTLRLVEGLQDRLKRRELGDVEKLKAALAEEMLSLLQTPAAAEIAARPRVVLMVGVNGVGKTTTIAKLAHQERVQGRTVLLIAGDTFRAAAAEQLEIWGERVGAEVIRQKAGADPAAVVFDGLAAALARDVDTVFIDTAGRLHTKVNLMEELKKVYRTAGKKLPGAPHEVFLVLDATTGQNALSQARLFHEAVGITGIILTKMDGTAKGGVALAVAHETGLPLRYLGLGEGLEDLRPFDAEAFVAAILGG